MDQMSHIANDVITPFIPVLNEKEVQKQSSSKCTRFLRKKHQCLIIYSLLTIVFLQTLMNIVSKLDDEAFNNVVNYISKILVQNETIVDTCNCTHLENEILLH